MSRFKDKEKAIKLREKGFSYSQIKNELGIGKSTLSNWLHDMPLSDARLKELRNTDAQIEKSRETKRKKKELRRAGVYEQVKHDIECSHDMDFVNGFYLYWGEGTKTAEYVVSLTNTDPSIIRCFVQWLELLDVPSEQIRVKLHVYSDQNEMELKKYWSKVTGVPVCNFYKTYTKDSLASRKTYKGMFSHGTCVVIYGNRDTYEYVIEGIKFLRDKYSM